MPQGARAASRGAIRETGAFLGRSSCADWKLTGGFDSVAGPVCAGNLEHDESPQNSISPFLSLVLTHEDNPRQF